MIIKNLVILSVDDAIVLDLCVNYNLKIDERSVLTYGGVLSWSEGPFTSYG